LVFSFQLAMFFGTTSVNIRNVEFLGSIVILHTGRQGDTGSK
jgi:hypothetical protein